MQHHINTSHNYPPSPITVPPYRMDPMKKELLMKKLDSILEQNIIEEYENPCACSVVLILKPDGKMRLCIDYRKVNAQIIPDSYQCHA